MKTVELYASKLTSLLGFHKWETYWVNTGYFARRRRRCLCCDTWVRYPKHTIFKKFGAKLEFTLWKKADFRASEDKCSIQHPNGSYESTGIPANTTVGNLEQILKDKFPECYV